MLIEMSNKVYVQIAAAFGGQPESVAEFIESTLE